MSEQFCYSLYTTSAASINAHRQSVSAVTAEMSYRNAEQKAGAKRTGEEDMSSAEFTNLYTFT